MSESELNLLPKVNCQLIGLDGNSFSIMSRWASNARKAKWPQTAIKTVIAKCTSGDYEHLLKTIISYSYNTDGSNDPEDPEDEVDPWDDKD